MTWCGHNILCTSEKIKKKIWNWKKKTHFFFFARTVRESQLLHFFFQNSDPEKTPTKRMWLSLPVLWHQGSQEHL